MEIDFKQKYFALKLPVRKPFNAFAIKRGASEQLKKLELQKIFIKVK